MIIDRLREATGGRQYCFVIMSYHGDLHIFEVIRAIVGEVTGLSCIRADDISGPGEDLRPILHAAIDDAAFVIAELSDRRPNVYYEVGYASARNKEILLLAKQGVKMDADLQGTLLIRYSTTSAGWPHFQDTLRRHLAAQVGLSHISLLRSMIIPRHPSPAYILANPKVQTPQSRFRTHPDERRTYGDYLGVFGILRSFALVHGDYAQPELLSAAQMDETLVGEAASFYLIGSPKVNKMTEAFLAQMQPDRSSWTLKPASGEEKKEDPEYQLSGVLSDGRIFDSPLRLTSSPYTPLEDYGLILRGPNPHFPDRLAVILAGPHSHGTGAACLGATDSTLIGEIAKKLPNGMSDLGDHGRTLWVLLRANPEPDSHISAGGIEIIDAGIYIASDP